MGNERVTVREHLVKILMERGNSREQAETLILNLLHQEKRLIQREGLSKLDVSKEPHWLYKDFNVLYRVANRFVQAMHGVQDEAAQRALDALVAQLSRLAPAFTDTEEIRAAMRGE